MSLWFKSIQESVEETARLHCPGNTNWRRKICILFQHKSGDLQYHVQFLHNCSKAVIKMFVMAIHVSMAQTLTVLNISPKNKQLISKYQACHQVGQF